MSVTNLWTGGSIDFPGFAKADGLSLNGPGAGLTLGYDYSVSPGLVVGGAADFNGSVSQFSLNTPGQSLAVRDYASWALRGRLGTEISPGTLVYGTAGFSQMFGDAEWQGAVNGKSGRQTFNGAVFGFGVETPLDVNMFIRFEYLHGLYGRQSYDGGLFTLTPSTDSARVTLVWRPDDGGGHAHAEAPRVDWSGLYVGGFGGWETGRVAASYPNVLSVAGAGGAGPSVSGVVGVNFQNNRALAGVETEVSANTAKAAASDTAGDRLQASAPVETAVRARFGALVLANTMFYGAFGGAFTHANAEWTLSGSSHNASQNFGGVQYGVGVETMLTPHLGARVEYLETRYSRQNYYTPTTAKTQTGLIYKF